MKKFIRKNTVWNVFASLFVIFFMVGVAANAVLIKYDLLSAITGGKYYVRAWAADYVMENIEGFTFASILEYLPTIGVGLGAFLLLLLPICFAKHGKGWNWIPLLLILGDTVWYALEAFRADVFFKANSIGEYFSTVFTAPFEKFLTPADINLMFHVVVLIFLVLGAAKGTKKVMVAAEPAPVEENKPVYRTITVMRKIAPFARTTAYDCWFNGENLSEIADGQEKSFLVDEYGAEFVVVSPTGEESNVVNIAEGHDDQKYIVSTGRNAKGELHIEIVRA